MEKTYAIEQVNLYEDGQVIPNAVLVVENGFISYAGPQEKAPGLSGVEVINGLGHSIAPGYIDLQLNGGFGMDFSSDPGALLETARKLPQTGVVAFLATFITSPLETYPEKLLAVEQAQKSQKLNPEGAARILGAHVEGPFLNPATKGAHNQNLFVDPAPSALKFLQPDHVVRLLTLAPERSSALQAIRQLSAQGVVISIGHSNATSEETIAGIEAGARYATHCYNAMRGMQHRDPGLVGVLLTDEQITCGLIVDGIHVHPRMVKLAYKALGARRITLVTDAMAAMGMPPGDYVIGDQKATVDETTARLTNGTLAGSILRMDQAVRNMIAFSGCTPAEALRMATTTPAELLGIEHETGHLLPGYPADFVTLDGNLQVLQTFIAGQLVYSK